ncbi:MAG: hypothetical protein V1915_02230 [Candidatus Bathyarchaeota archaeon]
MGKTQTMINRERRENELKIKRENIPAIEIMTDELKESAGLNRKYVPDFSGGTAGLKVKKDGNK